MYYPVQTQITPLTTIRRERLLPARGEVLVRPGQMVESTDVVASCLVPGEVRVLDVSRALGIPREGAGRYVRKTEGASVLAGELIAAPKGLFGRLKTACRSPLAGQIVAVRNGLVLIEGVANTFDLLAHFPGQVTNIMPELGAVIAASGALIQGVWGNGLEAEGVLKIVTKDGQEPFHAHAIDISCQGTIIVGGRLVDKKTFDEALEAQVRGIIAGSVSAEWLPLLRSLPFPVLITEGLGSMPMAEEVFSLLFSNKGRQAMLNASVQTRWDARRPEVFVPLRVEGKQPAEESEILPLKVGARVRVVRAPYLGSTGTVSDLPSLPRVVESGARLPVAVVDLGEEEPALIPLSNLELIR